jgi:hypothetical protein
MRERRSPWGSGILALVTLLACPVAACGGLVRPVEPQCEWQRPSETAPARSREPRAAHPEIAELRAFRSYVQVTDVGDYGHHFAVWYQCIEPNVLVLSVVPGPGRPDIRLTRGAWGGLGVRPDDVPPVPPAARDMAEQVMGELRRRVSHARDPQITYLGAYREVTVAELVPASPPGDPMQRSVIHTQLVLRANESLTTVERTVADASGGITRLCWEDSDYVPCHDAPYWVPFTAPSPWRGDRLLPPLARGGDGVPEALRQEFVEATLAVARGRLQGAPRVPLAQVHGRGEGSVLPATLEQQVVLNVRLYARVESGNHRGERDGHLELLFSTAGAVFGHAEATDQTTAGGLAFHAHARLSADAPSPAEAHGEQELDFTLELTVSDERGNEHRRTIPVKGRVVLDAGRAATLAFEADFGQTGTHEPPRHMDFPGHDEVRQIDAYVEQSLYSATWRP